MRDMLQTKLVHQSLPIKTVDSMTDWVMLALGTGLTSHARTSPDSAGDRPDERGRDSLYKGQPHLVALAGTPRK